MEEQKEGHNHEHQDEHISPEHTYNEPRIHESHHEMDKKARIDNNPDKLFNISKIKKQIKKNPWIFSSITFGIIAIILLVIVLNGGTASASISEEKAGEKIIEFLNGQTGGGVEYISAEDIGNLYEIVVSYQDQEIPVFVTKDGEYFVQGAVPITGKATQTTAEPIPTEITKSDKPILEAIVTPYCPYGLQYMKGLLPVYELMKDKADISILSLGITHMENEKLETQRQICINQKYDKDKMFEYIKEIIYDKTTETCYADYHNGENQGNVAYFDECMKPAISSVMKKLNINENTINTCIEEEGDTLYNEAVEYARSKGASGSPSPFLNGAKLTAGRSPEAIKTALCSAFNTEPSECSTILSEETPDPGITTGTSSSTNAPTTQC